MSGTGEIRFDGKVALVTGAGRGLGRAYALDLARRGAKVVVNDANVDMSGGRLEGATPAEDVVAQITANGGEAVVHLGNVADADDARDMVDAAVSRWGRIDIVVNNAGQMRKLTFSQSSVADFTDHFQVHVLGSYLVSRAAWTHMAAQGGGAIVLTTSQVGMYGQLDAAAYGTAKMGVMGLLHAMKLEAPTRGIRVNAIAPFALTRMGEGTFPEAMRPYIDPALVAPAVTWMASDRCDWNGEILIAGGGHFARARVSETTGIDIDNPAGISAEAIHAHNAEIADTAGILMPDNALSAVGTTFARLARLSGTPI
ncbi:SDR family NAD(P)-dependent oxidoreductase [Novosphingobium colocasiae]|nr:SDR family NAD(P)-dependent oxidoreductase [Novosphingobium colocasiae]